MLWFCKSGGLIAVPIGGGSKFSKAVFPCPISLCCSTVKVRSELHERKQGQGKTWLLRGRRTWSFEKGRICVCNKVFVHYFLYKNVVYVLKKICIFSFLLSLFRHSSKEIKSKSILFILGFFLWVLLVTESPIFKDFCNEYQQLTPYVVFFFFLWVNFFYQRTCFKLDTSRVWYAICMPCCCYQIFTGLCWAQSETLLVFTCHYFYSLLFEGKHTAGLQMVIRTCLSTADEVWAVYFLWKVNFTRMATL